MGFADDLRNHRMRVAKRADAVVRKIVFDVGTSLVFKSPVGDASYWTVPAPPGYVGGRFRANWQYGEGELNLTTTTAVDPQGTLSFSQIYNKIDPKAAGKVHYLSNSLPYSLRLENGYSRQAPHGMRDLTILEFGPIVAAAARALNP